MTQSRVKAYQRSSVSPLRLDGLILFRARNRKDPPDTKKRPSVNELGRPGKAAGKETLVALQPEESLVETVLRHKLRMGS